MRSLTICVILLASGAIVNADDNLIEKYYKYLLTYMEPCAAEWNMTPEELRSIQMVPKASDLEKLGCLRACVMKRMNSMVDKKVQLGPLNQMIESVHAGNPADIEKVKTIASECVPEAEAESEDCKIAMKYADCYINRLMSGN